MTRAHIGDTERFVHELSRSLRPVRRVARLRHAAGVVMLAWLATSGGLLALKGLRADLREAALASPAFAAILAGLGLVAFGGVAAALGQSVPGRTLVARAGLASGLAGVVTAVVVGAVLVARGGPPLQPADPISADVACLCTASLLALPPGLGALAFVGRAAAFRPLLVALFAAAATVALGAVAVHLSCSCASGRHLIVGHAMAPVIGALLLAIPYHAVLTRVARGSEGGVPPF